MFTRLCIIEGNCLYVGVFCLDVCSIEVCRCADVQVCTRYRELEELAVLLVMLIKQALKKVSQCTKRDNEPSENIRTARCR